MKAQKAPRPTGIRAPHGRSFFEISWDNGKSQRIDNEILRGYCPCAGCQGHSGSITFQEGNNADLRDIKTVGNYALSLVWGDRHDTGIYSFEYLYQLAELQEQHGAAGLIEMGILQRAKVVAAGTVQETSD